MKLDQETLVKHQFWFLLGGAVLLWMVGAIWLKLAASEPIEKAKSDYEKAENELTTWRNPVNPATFNPPWEKYGGVFDGHKQVIWKDAWQFQLGMYDWPFSNKDMSRPQTELSQDERELYKRELYPNEVKQLRELMEPDSKSGSPGMLSPVELAGGFDNVFKPQEWKLTPTREECWLAQEDYWVKRELLYDVARTIALRAYMQPTAIDRNANDDNLPEGYLMSLRYRNDTWEVTLHIKPSKGSNRQFVVAGDSTIKNIHPSRLPQSLTSAKGGGLEFNVYHADGKGARIEVRGEPVPYGVAQPFGKEDSRVLENIDWQRAKTDPEKFAVFMSQAFDWYTCPIRRVEAIALGQQSCRTYTTVLKANDTLAQLDPPAKDLAAEGDANKQSSSGSGSGSSGGASSGSMTGGSMGMGKGSGSMMPGGIPGMRGGARQATNVTPNNGIDRDRYLQAPKKASEEEKPSRHLPLAVQLIVEQSHIHQVVSAFSNSRLRIQITQVEFHHAKGIKPEIDPEKGGDASRTAPVFSAGMGGGAMPPGMMGSAGMGRGGGKAPPMMGSAMPPGTIGSRPPAGAGGAMGGGSKTPPMMGSMMMPGRFGSGASGPGMAKPTLPAAGAGGVTAATSKKPSAKPDDDSLVELTVYGIATLYRLPSSLEKPAPQNGAAPSTPPTPATGH